MPAADILFSRVQRQLEEVERNLERMEADPSDSSSAAVISATLGTLVRSLNDLEQVLKRDTLLKEQHKASFRELEKRHSFYKSKFDALKSQRLETERRKRRSDLLPEASHPLLPNASAQAYHEGESLDRSNAQLDQVIELGSSALDRIRSQGKTMKAAHKKALDAAMSLDVGKTLVRVIGRKTKEDKIIFYAGILSLVFVFYFCWKYFG